MNKYIDDEECPGCDEYINPFGCTDHNCRIYKDYQEGRAEDYADRDHDRRKEDRIEQGS